MIIRRLALLLIVFSLPATVRPQESNAAQNSATQNEVPRSARPEEPPQGSASTAAVAESANSPKLDLTPDANGALSQEQMQQLFRVVADKDLENDKKLRDYTYIERDVQKNLDGKGQT